MKRTTALKVGKMVYAVSVGWLCAGAASSFLEGILWFLTIVLTANLPLLFVEKEAKP